jgi:flavin reductase (DIM6/NTAB) family NADH-FMN oxidoreductase RutF
MEINGDDIRNWEDKYRIRFINSLTGYKGVYLIGTHSEDGLSNLALFNSVVHVGASPPLVGFVMRPPTVARHTYRYLLQSGCYTINHVHKSFLKQAHYTSAKFAETISEFSACNLTEQRIDGFAAPFVRESRIKFGLKLTEDHVIKENGTHFIVGEIVHVLIDDDVVGSDGQLDLEVANDVCVTGLNQYSSVTKFVKLPAARVEEVPALRAKDRADNVVFDREKQTYHANILPYGTNIGAPRIEATGVSAWKNTSISSFNHTFENKMASLKNTYQQLIDEYHVNEMLYAAHMNFEPIVGETYYLYFETNKDRKFLSLIPPTSWRMEFVGAFKLNHDKLWEKVG